jgi:hypothetical protein
MYFNSDASSDNPTSTLPYVAGEGVIIRAVWDSREGGFLRVSVAQKTSITYREKKSTPQNKTSRQ